MKNWRTNLGWPENVTTEDVVIEYLYENDDDTPNNDFDNGKALAALLLSDAVFLNSNWWHKDWPDQAKNNVAVCVNTNDIFMWGCADAEEITYEEIEQVYRYWVKDPIWGTAIWAVIRNKELPQKPVIDDIRKAGIWDLDALTQEYKLRANHYDGICGVLTKHKRDVYVSWCDDVGLEPLPFDAGWWTGWDEYVKSHHDWYDDAWKKVDDEARSTWRLVNGFVDASLDKID